MAKKKVVYLEDPEITIMSLVELGANYKQVEGGKTVLVMKSATGTENSEQENKGMTEKEKLETYKRKLELDLVLVNDELGKLGKDGQPAGEVATPEKPVDNKVNTEPEATAEEKPEASAATGQEDLAERVKELEAQNAEKDKEIAALNAKIEQVVDAQLAYFQAEIPANAAGDK